MLNTVATVVLATIALLAAIGGGIAWFYRRGRQEQSLTSSIDKQAEATNRNTTATAELAAQVGGLRQTLQSHGETLVEHHYRLKALENK